jgi:hypothetical protein
MLAESGRNIPAPPSENLTGIAESEVLTLAHFGRRNGDEVKMLAPVALQTRPGCISAGLLYRDRTIGSIHDFFGAAVRKFWAYSQGRIQAPPTMTPANVL